VNVRVQNRGQTPATGVALAFEPGYIHAFAAVAFEPTPDTPYEIEIGTLEPGESRLVSVQVTAEEYGAHRGLLSLSAGETQAGVELSTFIFP